MTLSCMYSIPRSTKDPASGGLASLDLCGWLSSHLHGLDEMTEEGSPSGCARRQLGQSRQGGWQLHLAGKPAGALPRLTCGPGSSASHSHGLRPLLRSGWPSSSAAWVQACSSFLGSLPAVLLAALSLGLHRLGTPYEEPGKPAACVHWPQPLGHQGSGREAHFVDWF